MGRGGGREGGTPKADDSTDKLRECDSDKGDGGQKFWKFCGRHISMAPLLLEYVLYLFLLCTLLISVHNLRSPNSKVEIQIPHLLYSVVAATPCKWTGDE